MKNGAVSRTYYALGDSMSIDAYAGGPGHGAASLLADDFGYDLRLLATDGATSDTVLRMQLNEIDSQPDLITLTMGGNDLVHALFEDPRGVARAVERVRFNADLVLRTLRLRAGQTAPIIVSTVYDPTDGTGDFQRLGLHAVSADPRDLDALNAALRAAASRHGALVADLHAKFLGHGTSAGDINRPDPRPADRELWFCGAIEPNAWGAMAIRDAWRETLFGLARHRPPVDQGS
jgi:lysophospholipase L1-like esterase